MSIVLYIALGAAALFLLNDLIQLLMQLYRSKRKLYYDAASHVNNKEAADSLTSKQDQQTEENEPAVSPALEKKMQAVEALFVQLGAKPMEHLNQRNRKRFGQRMIYFFQDNYYQVDRALLNGTECLVLHAVDREPFANIGIMEDAAIFPWDQPMEETEKQVKAVMGLDGNGPVKWTIHFDAPADK